MLWELLTGTKDPTAAGKQTAFDIVYSVLIYIVCAFAVFAFHDFVQRRKAKKYGLEVLGTGLKNLVANGYNLFAAAMFVIFGVAFKQRIALSKDPGRKKSFMLSFCGVFLCFVASAVIFVLLQGAYLLRDDAGIGFFGVFIPWLTALFTTLVTVSVFSVILCVVPNDGGHILAAAAPYEARDKLLAVPNYVSVFLAILFSLIFAKTYFTNAVVGKVWDIFNFAWTGIAGLFVK